MAAEETGAVWVTTGLDIGLVVAILAPMLSVIGFVVVEVDVDIPGVVLETVATPVPVPGLFAAPVAAGAPSRLEKVPFL